MTNQHPQARLTYAAPQLRRLGALEEVTLGHSSGAKTDAYFPLGTAHSSVTFS